MTVLDRPHAAPVDLSLARFVATLLAAVLFVIGWTAAKVVQAASWCVTAVRVGWDDARRPGGG